MLRLRPQTLPTVVLHIYPPLPSSICIEATKISTSVSRIVRLWMAITAGITGDNAHAVCCLSDAHSHIIYYPADIIIHYVD
ncbi:2-(3-amino-3-carboxypropyl)histidine synthase subunit [Trichinella spiralis]|uniref:2-(3-amino-3-carboxypropyl)histidine synthase subunit n=1 Tax=Trichinella spiralis TaxID=6334 RepID=A0ABR3KLI7_TRISP